MKSSHKIIRNQAIGVVAATGVSDGYVDNSIPLQFPELTTTELSTWVSSGNPKLGQKAFNTTLGVFVFFDGTAFSENIRFEVHTWTLSGEVKVPSGDTDFINGMDILVPTGWTCKITKVRDSINSGTSATYSIQDDGVGITGFIDIVSITAKNTTEPTAQVITTDSRIVPVVSNVVGTPTNMSITIQLIFTRV